MRRSARGLFAFSVLDGDGVERLGVLRGVARLDRLDGVVLRVEGGLAAIHPGRPEVTPEAGRVGQLGSLGQKLVDGEMEQPRLVLPRGLPPRVEVGGRGDAVGKAMIEEGV